ncbi:MAG TPA: RHS repeat-associated core domain-containing protein [Pseudomonas sp.]|jgi:RHS repeat-associated protein|uniref:RHS repeat-associated core domain-containing protein n=1 Tax=Pseudomonas sp. TaxID=306 RepID=UPI002EDB7CE9
MSQQTLINYRYDALDRLIGFDLPDQGRTTRVYNNGRVASQIRGDQSIAFIDHADVIFGHSRTSGSSIENTLIGTSQQGSVLQTATAAGRQDFQYTPHGYCSNIAGLDDLLGFNGEHPDPITGCYLLGSGYRVYNPVLMRFHSPDSMSPFGAGGVNPYAYCVGDPINLSDPTGHFSWKSIFKIFVAVVTIAVAVATLVVAPASGVVVFGALSDIASNVLGIGSTIAKELAPQSEIGNALEQFSLTFSLLSFAAGRGVLGKGKVPTTLTRQGALRISNGQGLRGVGGAANLGRKARNTVKAADRLAKVKKGADSLKYAGYGVTGVGIAEDYVIPFVGNTIIPYLSPPQSNKSSVLIDSFAGQDGQSGTRTGSYDDEHERIRSIRSPV